jgi:thiopurine S-methyltransferase
VLFRSLSPIAAEAAFEESGIPFSMRRRDDLNFYEGTGLTIICGDIFKVRREHVGPCDRVWDRAAMVALSPSVHAAYVAKITELVTPGRILLNAFTCDQSLRDGPPFATPQRQVRALYPEMEVVGVVEDIESIRQTWRDLGIESWITTTYLIDV